MKKKKPTVKIKPKLVALNRQQVRDFLHTVSSKDKKTYWITYLDIMGLVMGKAPMWIAQIFISAAIKGAGLAREDNTKTYYSAFFFTHKKPTAPRFMKSINFITINAPS